MLYGNAIAVREYDVGRLKSNREAPRRGEMRACVRVPRSTCLRDDLTYIRTSYKILLRIPSLHEHCINLFDEIILSHHLFSSFIVTTMLAFREVIIYLLKPY